MSFIRLPVPYGVSVPSGTSGAACSMSFSTSLPPREGSTGSINLVMVSAPVITAMGTRPKIVKTASTTARIRFFILLPPVL